MAIHEIKEAARRRFHGAEISVDEILVVTDGRDKLEELPPSGGPSTVTVFAASGFDVWSLVFEKAGVRWSCAGAPVRTVAGEKIEAIVAEAKELSLPPLADSQNLADLLPDIDKEVPVETAIAVAAVLTAHQSTIDELVELSEAALASMPEETSSESAAPFVAPPVVTEEADATPALLEKLGENLVRIDATQPGRDVVLNGLVADATPAIESILPAQAPEIAQEAPAIESIPGSIPAAPAPKKGKKTK